MASAPQTLSALLKRATIDDHEAVLKACNLELRQSKGNLEAQHHKCVALLKLDRYDDALRVLEEGGDLLKEKAQLERAYALYKIGELVEAKTIAGAITNHRGARHIEAQAVCSFYLGTWFANGTDYILTVLSPGRLLRCLGTVQRLIQQSDSFRERGERY